MDIDISRVRLFNQIDHPFNGLAGISLNRAIAMKHIKVIALGNKAMKYLMDVEVHEFFLLPHPSGLNRKLNDKEFIKNKLSQCRDYVYEKTEDLKTENSTTANSSKQSYKEQETVLEEG